MNMGLFGFPLGDVAERTLIDCTLLYWDLEANPMAAVTLRGNRSIFTLALKPGTFILSVIQDPTGSRTMTWDTVFKWPLNITPTLTTTANQRDIFSFVCNGTYMFGAQLKGYPV